MDAIRTALQAAILLAISLTVFASRAVAHDGGLPLGDGHVSSTPREGYVMSCQDNFRRAGGAQHLGDWVSGNLWYPSEKIHVQGRNIWKEARFSTRLVERGGKLVRVIYSNDLPTAGYTGNFPVAPTDPAYEIDRNPNSVRAQREALVLPANPRLAASAFCVPMGMIGIATNGVSIFNALDAGGKDAVAHEVQDGCDGHPQRNGEYHYHGPSACIPHIDGNAQLVGYALDGFGIYSMRDAAGHELRSKDLDACHGITSTVMWNGKPTRIYHYVMTRDYPYTIGCFRGTPIRAQLPRMRGRRNHRGPGGIGPGFRRPPPDGLFGRG